MELRFGLTLGMVAWAALDPSGTQARPGPARIALFAPPGRQGGVALQEATAALKADGHLSVLKAADVSRAVARLHASPKTEEGRAQILKSLGAKAGVRLLLVGTRKVPLVSARVYTAEDGGEVGTATWPLLRRPTPHSVAGLRQLQELVRKAVRPAPAPTPAPAPPNAREPKVVELEDTPRSPEPRLALPPERPVPPKEEPLHVSSPPESRPVAEPARRGAVASDEEASATRTEASDAPGPGPSETPMLDLALELGTLSRSLAATGDPTGSLTPYKLGFGPTLGGTLEIYPLQAVTDSVLGELGLRFWGEAAIGLESSNSRGTHFPTSSNALEGALTYRVALSALTLVPAIGIGREIFVVSTYPGQQSRPDIPGVSYRRIRPAVDARVKLTSSLRLLLRAAYLKLTSEGDIATPTYFPHTSGSGLEVGAGLALALSGPFEGRLMFDYRRYGLTFNPAPADARQAQGASDQFYGLTLAFSYRGL